MLSKNWKKRHYAHKRIIKGKSDSVKKYFDGIGVEIPLPIIRTWGTPSTIWMEAMMILPLISILI